MKKFLSLFKAARAPTVTLPSIPAPSADATSFSQWTYSRRIHFDYFLAKGYDRALFGAPVDPGDCNLKVYQDLLTFAFILENVPKGARILDIGGGNSRILNHFKDDYECWNIDKLEGMGNGPTEIDTKGIKLVLAYMGDFSPELPENHFDFVFSISVMEHVAQQDEQLHKNISADIQRVLKPGGMCLHSLDCVKHQAGIWTNPILRHFYQSAGPISGFIEFSELLADPDLYTMSEKFYKKTWQFTTNKTFQEFGAPLSYNFCSIK